MAKKNKEPDEMFADFGELDSFEEINQAAAGFYEEGDIDSLKAFAKENGFTEEDVAAYQRYAENDSEGAVFCDPIMAAVAKLELEKKENPGMGAFADDIIQYLESELDDMSLAKGIRRKGKRLKEAAGLIMQEAMSHSVTVGGRKANYCGPMSGFKLVRDYYTEEEMS